MEIKKNVEGKLVTLGLVGRLDTVTSGALSEELNQIFEKGEADLLFDFAELEYISSAGLRVLLIAQKKVNALGTAMRVCNANESVREVFEITGFSGILTIE